MFANGDATGGKRADFHRLSNHSYLFTLFSNFNKTFTTEIVTVDFTCSGTSGKSNLCVSTVLLATEIMTCLRGARLIFS